jgi:hypothetical protein
VFGAILLHLRDPFLGLEHALRLTRETAVVVDVAPWDGLSDGAIHFLNDSHARGRWSPGGASHLGRYNGCWGCSALRARRFPPALRPVWARNTRCSPSSPRGPNRATISFPLVRNEADCIPYISARRATKAAPRAGGGPRFDSVNVCKSAGLCRSDTVGLTQHWRKQNDGAVCAAPAARCATPVPCRPQRSWPDGGAPVRCKPSSAGVKRVMMRRKCRYRLCGKMFLPPKSTHWFCCWEHHQLHYEASDYRGSQRSSDQSYDQGYWAGARATPPRPSELPSGIWKGLVLFSHPDKWQSEPGLLTLANEVPRWLIEHRPSHAERN